jgi:hypothetical protein
MKTIRGPRTTPGRYYGPDITPQVVRRLVCHWAVRPTDHVHDLHSFAQNNDRRVPFEQPSELNWTELTSTIIPLKGKVLAGGDSSGMYR